MFCPKCGSQIPDNAAACPNCGELTAAHKACTNCGMYNGRQVVVKKDEQ